MKLEIKHLESELLYQIDPEGAVLGRERARTDIAVADKSVSKRHARIYAESGQWFLEDLGSSNGTFVNAQRINSPVVLNPGSMFALSENQFQVVQVVREGGQDNGAAPARLDSDALLYDVGPDVMDDPLLDDPASAQGMSLLEGGPLDDEDSGLASDPPPAGDGFGSIFIAAPKAIGYYMVNVPLLALNPIGTIKKGVREPKMDAMGKFELGGYALPPMLFVAALAWLSGLIASLIAGAFSLGNLPIVPLAIAAVSAIISGFVVHPFLTWLVKFLKGSCTAQQRTNFFLMSMCGYVLMGIPTGLAFLGATGIPFIGIVPVVIALVGQLLLTFISSSWFKAFGVVKWFQILILLGGVGSCYGAAMAVKAQVEAALVSTPDGATAPPDTEATEGAEGATGEGLSEAEMKARLEEAAEKKIGTDPEETKGEKKGPEKAGKPDKAEKAEKKEPEKAAQPEKVEKAAEPEPEPDPTPDEAAAEIAAQPTGFLKFLKRREWVEKQIADDPTLLKNKYIRKNYQRLHNDSEEIRAKYRKRKKGVPAALQKRLKDLEVYESTRATVKRLYDMIRKEQRRR